jgi:hypothetical protein
LPCPRTALARLYFEPTKARQTTRETGIRQVKAWHAFRGSLDPSVPDCIERRLRTAEQSLQAEIGPILLPESAAQIGKGRRVTRAEQRRA